MSPPVSRGRTRRINAGPKHHCVLFQPCCCCRCSCSGGRGGESRRQAAPVCLLLCSDLRGEAAASWESMPTLLAPHLLLCTHHRDRRGGGGRNTVMDLWSRPVIPVLLPLVWTHTYIHSDFTVKSLCKSVTCQPFHREGGLLFLLVCSMLLLNPPVPQNNAKHVSQYQQDNGLDLQ